MSSTYRHIFFAFFGILILGDCMGTNKSDNDFYYYMARVNIKKYRKKANLTAQELADKSGFTHQFIRDLESLKLIKRPRLDSLGRIANALNIHIRQLFDDIDNNIK